MPKRSSRNTRSRIVAAAWELFYENGYDDTTVDDIVERSGTSKGSFYHYFAGKDALLSSLSTLFDEKYQELIPNMDPVLSAFDQLIYLNHELFFMIENSVSLDLLARLLSTQLVTTSEKHLMDQNRYYFKILRKICTDGQRSGELRQDISMRCRSVLCSTTGVSAAETILFPSTPPICFPICWVFLKIINRSNYILYFSLVFIS